MEKNGLFEKNKSKILNSGIIVLALFIAFQIYKTADQNINALTIKKNDELERNRVTEEIAGLEKKIEIYKNIFPEEDMSSIVEAISNIAKNSSINIVSIKPIKEEKSGDYSRMSFFITVNSPDYHSLGNFISLIESNKNIYIVDEISIAGTGNKTETANAELNVTLRISTISY